MNVMQRQPPVPFDESLRLAAVERYKLAGIGREAAFDHVTQLAADMFDVPISLVSIVGSDMQCFRGACGLEASGTSRDVAFCAFAILGDDVMVVPDATMDPRFAENALVIGEPHIRFYAGAPLKMSSGERVGTLCIIDSRPRSLSLRDRRRLAGLARSVVDLIEMRVERFAADDHRAKLDAQHELLKLTVENASEGVALFDGDLRLTVWNEKFVDLFDYPPGQVFEGAQADRLMLITAKRGELGPGNPREIVAGLMASVRQRISREYEIQRAGRTLHLSRKTILGGRFILTVRDITDEHQMARLKDELVSTVSHELRTPLSAISGALGLLGGGTAGELPPKAAHLVKIGAKNAERLMMLVNDLLDMNKLESGKMPFHFQDGDLCALLADMVEQNQPYAERHGARLRLDCPGKPLHASIDAARLFQVVTNLVSNACKFSPDQGEVLVSLRREGDHARITVSDQGPGIGEEFRSRLFGRFAQEDGAHQHGHAGTGLGLAISKAIVDEHRGTIELDPDVPAGATFHVRLPLERDTGAGA